MLELLDAAIDAALRLRICICRVLISILFIYKIFELISQFEYYHRSMEDVHHSSIGSRNKMGNSKSRDTRRVTECHLSREICNRSDIFTD